MPRIHPTSLTVNAISADGQRLHLDAVTQLEVDCGNGIRLLFEAPKPACNLTIQKAVGKKRRALTPKKKQIRRWVKAALQQQAEITIRFVEEAEGRALNHQFRGKDYPTNVLSFTYDDELPSPEHGTPPMLGDLVLCVPVVAQEATAQNKTLEAHYAHLIVHGTLHLQGHDHENADEAEAMEALERSILATLGYADPYAA